MEGYATALQAIVRLAHDQNQPRTYRQREREITEQIVALNRTFPLTGVEIEQVRQFLADLRAKASLEPVTYDDRSSESAHVLALEVIDLLAQRWEKYSEIASRSRNDPRYLYSTTCTRLFFDNVLAKSEAKPQDLYSMLALEYRAALQELDRLAQPKAPTGIDASHVTVTGNAVTVAAQPNEVAAPPPRNEESPRPTPSRFPTPSGARWRDLFIRFSDGHTVLARIGDVSRTFNYTQMGMNDGRNGKPNKQWELLRAFADGRGTLTWDHPSASDKNQKRKEMLAADLKAFFGLPGDPFEPADGGWRTLFALEPDA